MRTKNSLINIAVSICSYGFLMVSSFLTRGVFSRELGLAIAGIEGLFLNIVSMLAIAELGIGVGIVYKLYKPIADNDKVRIAVLLNFYKKAYMVIGTVVLLLGVGTASFVWVFIDDKAMYSKWQLSLLFMFYVFDVLSSYLYAHKRAMFTADQKNYVNNIAHTICQGLSCILQVTTLILFKSFVVYLIIKVSLRLLENVIISLQYNKKYKDIDLKIKEEMPKAEKDSLFKNIKAMFLHRVAGFSVSSTSSMIITSFVGVVANGIYYNYTLITNGFLNLTNQLFNGIVASFGDLLTTSTKDRSFENFKSIYLINYLIFSFFSVGILVVVQPFVRIWIGEKGLFPMTTVLLIVLLFYMTGMRQSVYMVRTSAGVYQPDKYLAVVEAILNIGMAIVLAKPLGINGVLCANLISLIAIPFWTQPYIAYKKVFGKSLWYHYKRYALYAVLTAAIGALTYFVCWLLPVSSLGLRVICNMVLAVIIPNGINILLFHKTPEFQYLKNTFTGLLQSVKNRKLQNKNT